MSNSVSLALDNRNSPPDTLTPNYTETFTKKPRNLRQISNETTKPGVGRRAIAIAVNLLRRRFRLVCYPHGTPSPILDQCKRGAIRRDIVHQLTANVCDRVQADTLIDHNPISTSPPGRSLILYYVSVNCEQFMQIFLIRILVFLVYTAKISNHTDGRYMFLSLCV